MMFSARKHLLVFLGTALFVAATLTVLHLAFSSSVDWTATPARPSRPTTIQTKSHSAPTTPPKPYARHKYSDAQFDFTKIQYQNLLLDQSTFEESDSVLVLSTIGNGNSYGRDRLFEDLFKTILSFKYTKNHLSLGLLAGDPDEFARLDAFFTNYFGRLRLPDDFVYRVTLLHAPFIEKLFDSKDRENRHSDAVQRLRRRQIARSRNFNLLHSLDNEKYTVFIDADITTINHPDMITRFVASGKDIIVPRIQRGDNQDYDKNSWRGQRTKPNQVQLDQMDSNQWDKWDYVPRDIDDKMFHFQTFVDLTHSLPDTDPLRKLDYIVPLDSVGGAILFAKSIVYKQGAIFPPNYIIGTTWDRLEGYDGIETEGLCYTAKALGYLCWGMPNLLAQHDPF